MADTITIPVRGVVIRHHTAATREDAFVPSGPVFRHRGSRVPFLGSRPLPQNVYFTRECGFLYVATSLTGPWRRVPAWVLLAYQWLPGGRELSDPRASIQTNEPIMWAEPGKVRRRKATAGEVEMVSIVTLRQFGKTWPEIGTILNIPRRVLAERRLEIMRVVKDLDHLGNTEQVDLDRCQNLKDGWSGHQPGGLAKGKKPRPEGAGPGDDDYEAFVNRGYGRGESARGSSTHGCEREIDPDSLMALRDQEKTAREAQAAENDRVEQAANEAAREEPETLILA